MTEKYPPSQKEFMKTIDSKIGQLAFDGDMGAILRAGVMYDQDEAWEWVRDEIIDKV